MRLLTIENTTELRQGFTLIELLIYMGIFSILLTLITSIFFSLLNQQEASQSVSAVDQNGRYILTRLEYDIQRAQSVSIPASYGAQSSSLQISINGINYNYALDSNGDLQLTNNKGTDTLNGYDTSISNLSFTRIGSSGGHDSVQVVFTISSRTQIGSSTEARTFKTTAGLRCTITGC